MVEFNGTGFVDQIKDWNTCDFDLKKHSGLDNAVRALGNFCVGFARATACLITLSGSEWVILSVRTATAEKVNTLSKKQNLGSSSDLSGAIFPPKPPHLRENKQEIKERITKKPLPPLPITGSTDSSSSPSPPPPPPQQQQPAAAAAPPPPPPQQQQPAAAAAPPPPPPPPPVPPLPSSPSQEDQGLQRVEERTTLAQKIEEEAKKKDEKTSTVYEPLSLDSLKSLLENSEEQIVLVLKIGTNIGGASYKLGDEFALDKDENDDLMILPPKSKKDQGGAEAAIGQRRAGMGGIDLTQGLLDSFRNADDSGKKLNAKEKEEYLAQFIKIRAPLPEKDESVQEKDQLVETVAMENLEPLQVEKLGEEIWLSLGPVGDGKLTQDQVLMLREDFRSENFSAKIPEKTLLKVSSPVGKGSNLVSVEYEYGGKKYREKIERKLLDRTKAFHKPGPVKDEKLAIGQKLVLTAAFSENVGGKEIHLPKGYLFEVHDLKPQKEPDQAPKVILGEGLLERPSLTIEDAKKNGWVLLKEKASWKPNDEMPATRGKVKEAFMITSFDEQTGTVVLENKQKKVLKNISLDRIAKTTDEENIYLNFKNLKRVSEKKPPDPYGIPVYKGDQGEFSVSRDHLSFPSKEEMPEVVAEIEKKAKEASVQEFGNNPIKGNWPKNGEVKLVKPVGPFKKGEIVRVVKDSLSGEIEKKEETDEVKIVGLKAVKGNILEKFVDESILNHLSVEELEARKKEIKSNQKEASGTGDIFTTILSAVSSDQQKQYEEINFPGKGESRVLKEKIGDIPAGTEVVLDGLDEEDEFDDEEPWGYQIRSVNLLGNNGEPIVARYVKSEFLEEIKVKTVSEGSSVESEQKKVETFQQVIIEEPFEDLVEGQSLLVRSINDTKGTCTLVDDDGRETEEVPLSHIQNYQPTKVVKHSLTQKFEEEKTD